MCVLIQRSNDLVRPRCLESLSVNGREEKQNDEAEKPVCKDRRDRSGVGGVWGRYNGVEDMCIGRRGGDREASRVVSSRTSRVSREKREVLCYGE